MKLLILSGRRKLFEDEASQVTLPGEDGEWSVWDFHQACLYRLRRGWIWVTQSPKEQKKFWIRGGIARVVSGMLTVLADES